MLAAPLELDHRAADRLQLLDGTQHLLLDQVEDLIVGDRELGQQLAACEVMHDVHDLEHDARMRAPPPLLRSDQQQVAGRYAVRHLVRNLKAEVPFEVFDRSLAQLAEPTHVVLVGGIHLIDAQESVDLLAVGEIQPMPVDHRTATQQVPDRGQIADREVFVAQPAPLAFAGRHPRRGRRGGSGRCIVGGGHVCGAPAARPRGGSKPDSLGPPNRPGYLKSSDARSASARR